MRAAPSRSLYRLAVFGLFGGAVLALWLIFRPPSVGEESAVINEPTTTPALTPGGGGSGTPGPTLAPTDAPTITPETSVTPTPAPTPTPGPIEYLVVDGDTWFGIAEAFGVDAFTLAQLNGQTLEDILNSGETLLIPQ